MSATYAFRDSDAALRRLTLLADVFEPTTRVFLRDHKRARAPLALDLGCGPGHTARLLEAELAAHRTVGLDNSRAFVERARERGIQAIEHDVRITPFPPGRPDLVFCRFLLGHLPEPTETLELWTRELRPGGCLLAEEVDGIETDDPVFARYLATVRDLLAARGCRLEAGRELAAGRLSRVVTVEAHPGTVARMFLLNIEAWRDQLDGSLSLELEQGLRAPRRRPIAWSLRQIVHEAAR